MLAPDPHTSNLLALNRRAAAPPKRAWGRVWLIGAGPGDPDLITVAGLKLVRAADVVVHDRLGAPALLAECRDDAVKIDVGKRAGKHALPQPEINALLAQHAMAGRTVVRLKGGDPFIFGRGGEEMLVLRQLGIQVDVVPGVTAASACAAATGIPLTHRGLASEVSLVTAHHRDGAPGCDWAELASGRDRTLVFYMGLSQAQQISAGLLGHGLPANTPVALISNGATAEQEALRCTLDTLPQAACSKKLASPCLIVVGAVVNLAHPRRVARHEQTEEAALWAA
ncbi:uroporphyrinogen-III C-methyltransferase [Pusillimonas noertemannii]|uniref:uroporphyrinogen-III C-methyltransferase n=1 Tax=Pusillimonas noertemannii TaxID=305977 RepID=A0A2U1CM40_9BURK|nr:uroporphyrinogen-III C-methyltransferase [Pusillimonas noertemannii]NYT68923.1 uroporphyrinogen-III C-methyltransferase [Pusillimonas noertemannii]PVY62057.1 uroporphyrin-III C-methyltransferase/precorrin-2 dehydrogenase/sirohydrochlorin ferrochelatase/uroporphyrin-III C-methyltransferase [Pusillimonas noertemannii]TFL10944.1 uroporphyrinogen-III C-methyltransferase [Pusillimonas noertemannii]